MIAPLHIKGSHNTRAVCHQTASVHSGIGRTVAFITQHPFRSLKVRPWQSDSARSSIIRTSHDLRSALAVMLQPHADDEAGARPGDRGGAADGPSRGGDVSRWSTSAMTSFSTCSGSPPWPTTRGITPLGKVHRLHHPDLLDVPRLHRQRVAEA